VWREAVQSWTRGRSRAEVLALVVWAGLLMVVCARVVCDGRGHSVYPIFAAAARDWCVGRSLYVVPRPAGLDQFRYSPLVAALLVPFTPLPLALGGMAWRLVNAAVYLGALAWCGRTVLFDHPSRAQRALLFLLVVPLSIGSLNNGQSNPLVIGLLLAAVAGLAAERWNLSSACLALACLLKVYPVALGLLLTVLFPRKFAGRFLFALGLGLALPFLLQRGNYVMAQYSDWLRLLCHDDRMGQPLTSCYRDLGLLCRLVDLPLSRGAYFLIQMTSGVGALALCLLGRRAGWSRRQVLMATLVLSTCWMTLLGPATESCTYMLLAPALAWAVMSAAAADISRSVRCLVIGSYGLFTLAALAVWFPGGSRWHALGVQPLAALLLLVGVVIVYGATIRHGEGTCAAGTI
jgi:hypothetical protein